MTSNRSQEQRTAAKQSIGMEYLQTALHAKHVPFVAFEAECGAGPFA